MSEPIGIGFWPPITIRYGWRVYEVGALVKTSPDSDRVFTVAEIEDDTRALIAPIDDTAPGAYPYWWPLRLLHPADG